MSVAMKPGQMQLAVTPRPANSRASDFVKTIRTAEELEKKNQFGSSLSHYLKAQKLYPASDFAREGVERLIVQVLPES